MLYPDAPDELFERRLAMVATQIAARGVRSPKVLDAMRAVPREAFVPEHMRKLAYQDSPLPIGAGQTISQPHVVALMIEALDLQGGENVLEVGGGSGYAAAVLGQIAGTVCSIERIEKLAQAAKETLAALGYDNIEMRYGDGTRGCPDRAPFDAIVVAAGTPEVPHALRQQLRVGGRLVIPLGRNDHFQHLVRITRVSEDEYDEVDLAPVRFVPLIAETYH